MTLNIKVVPDEKIKKFLMEKYQIPDYQADVCVAVSYTHLDVYKRQAIGFLRGY